VYPPGPRKSAAMRIHSLDQMRLSITTSSDGSVDFVRILGDVDMSDAHALGLAARQLVDADARLIYVDLGGTTFMGSTLVSFLVQLANHGRTGRPLVLCRPTSAALRVIHMTGLDTLTSIRPDLPDPWPEGSSGLDPASSKPTERSCAP
jgi:anti-anti-sigma factor